MKSEYELIFCVVNKGFADEAMDAARAAGAGGGTVFSARGTANPEAERIFNIPVQPEKDVLLIALDKTVRDNVMRALYEKVGLNTSAQGIAFSLPVGAVAGLDRNPIKKAEAKADEKKAEAQVKQEKE